LRDRSPLSDGGSVEHGRARSIGGRDAWQLNAGAPNTGSMQSQ